MGLSKEAPGKALRMPSRFCRRPMAAAVVGICQGERPMLWQPEACGDPLAPVAAKENGVKEKEKSVVLRAPVHPASGIVPIVRGKASAQMRPCFRMAEIEGPKSADRGYLQRPQRHQVHTPSATNVRGDPEEADAGQVLVQRRAPERGRRQPFLFNCNRRFVREITHLWMNFYCLSQKPV